MKRFVIPFVGILVLVGLILFRSQASTLEPTTFLEVSGQVGITFSNSVPSSCLTPFSTGSAWADYDNDGDVDLYITNQGGANALYRNDGDTNSDGLPDFTDVAATAGVTITNGVSIASVFIDYDNDNDQDLYVTNWDDDDTGTAFPGNVLFQNQLTESGSATFLDVTAAAGAGLDNGGVGNRSAWGDFDNDGFLDMYLTNHGDPEGCPIDPDNQDHLFHNNGDGTFTDVTEYVCNGSTTCGQVEGLGFSPGWVDFDNDGDLDLHLVNDVLNGTFRGNVLWRNDGPDGSGGWTFTDITTASGADLTINGMGLGVGDYDNDGWLDFAMSDGGPAELLRNLGNGTFANTAISSNVNSLTSGSITWGTVFFDHDNDGWQDLYFAAGGLGSPGQPNIFLGNNQDGTFVDLSASSGLDNGLSGKNVSIVDFDNDGFVDVLVNSYGGAVALYHNQGNANNWLTITVEGSTSNLDGIGTRLELTANGITQIREINDGPSHGGGDYKMAHFGLDDAASGILTVRWPNGEVQNLGTISANQQLHLVEPSPGGPLNPNVFDEVTSQVGIAATHSAGASCNPPIGIGSAWGDYDNDGDPDFFATNRGGANYLYRNDGDLNSDGLPDFTDVAAAMGVDDAGLASLGASFIDYDNDGDQDLYVTNWGNPVGNNILYENQLIETGSVSFIDVTGTAGIQGTGRTIMGAWGDFDQDGFLDLYIAKHLVCSADFTNNEDQLYHNNGDGTFTDVTNYLCSGASSCAEIVATGFAPGWFDYDNDGDLDLYIVNDRLNGDVHENVLWRNDGAGGPGWVFTDVSAATNTNIGLNGMGLGIGDYNNDGWFDLAFSNLGPARLLENQNGVFADISTSSGVNASTTGTTTWGTVFLDHDNDMWLDLLFVNGDIFTAGLSDANIFMHNNGGDGTFTDISVSSGLADSGRGRSGSIADFDGDGFVDVAVGNYDEEYLLFHNRGDNGANWLTVTVEGTLSNRDGIGTRLTLTADGITQMREITSGPTHGGGDQKAAFFGLGTATSGTLTVRWPNGVVENIGLVSANQTLHLIEPGGGGPISPTTFTEVASQVGLSTAHTLDGTVCGDGSPPISNGSAWADYDNDGDQDLYMTNQAAANHLYRNDGDTNSDGLPDFTDVAVAAGVDDPTAVGLGAVFVDYDNDGDQDLYVTNWDDSTGLNRLFENQLIESGSATFIERADAAGVNDTGRAITAAWGDFDQDSFLDLYITKHSRCLSGDRDPQDRLFHNNGDGTFTDVSGWLCDSGVAPCDQLTGQGFSPGWFDYDNDGDPDLFLINDYGGQFPYHNVLWRNDGSDGAGGWNFTDVTTPAGLDTTGIAGMGLGIGDYDNDGWFDLAWSDVGPVWLAHNEGDGTFTDTSGDLGTTGGTTWGTVFFDHENDGWLDAYYVSGAIAGGGIPNLFFGNNQDGTFTNLSVSSGLNDAGRGRSASIVDFDEDGFVDVMVGNYGENYVLYHNDAGNGANWLTITVEGTVSNRDGIGTRLTLTANGITQMREITSGPTHGGGDQKAAFFGLGTATSGTLTVRWPNGVVDNIGLVSANQQLHLVEPGTPPPTPTPGPTTTPSSTPLPPTPTNTPGPTATPSNTPLPPTPTNTPDGSGGTFTFTAVADASVLSNRADNNYGGSSTIAVDGSPIINSYLRFDVQGVTGSVSSAILRVWSNTTNGTGASAASVADNTWGETTITFNNAPAAGAVLGSSGATAAGAWAEFDVTGSVNADGLFSFMISTADIGRINFDSREAANDPELVIITSGGPTPTPTDTPVPPTATNTPTAGPSPTPTNTPMPPTATNTPVPGGDPVIYLSSSSGGTAGGVTFGDEDVLSHDTGNGSWAMYFDASDLGIVTNDVDAFMLMADGSILISLVRAQDLSGVGLGTVDDSDVLRFVPSSLGDTTAGTLEMYFDGSDVDLSTSGEDVDAVGLTPDGRLIISTVGNYSAGGVSGAGNDLLVLDGGVFGANTSGIWALYFDGEDVELSDATENISGVWVDANGDIYLATLGAFTVTGASGDGADVFTCTPISLGATTSCTYSLFWDGSANGFSGEIIDGLSIVP